MAVAVRCDLLAANADANFDLTGGGMVYRRATLLCGLALALSACTEPPDAAFAAPSHGPVAQKLLSQQGLVWHETDVRGARIYVIEGAKDDEEIRAIASDFASVRLEIFAVVGTPPAGSSPADLFFLSSREEMKRLAGRPLAGFVQPGEPTGVFVAAPGYRLRTLLKHELTHLYTYQTWGSPNAGAWLIEGIAVWVAGPCQGKAVDALAAGALTDHRLAPLNELIGRFRELPEDPAFFEAGSLAGFILREEGIAGIRRRWSARDPQAGHPLGPNGDDLETQWRQLLARTEPATLDIPALIASGC